MAAQITAAQETVLRSYVGQQEAISDLQDSYDRLENFDLVVLEILRKQLAIMQSDEAGIFVVDGVTINKTENMRMLRDAIKDFKNGGTTGLEADPVGGAKVVKLKRPDYR